MSKRTIKPRVFILGVSLLLLSQISFSQLFEIKEGSKKFDVKIDVQCEKDQCGGKAEITLFKKGTKQIFQKFNSEDLTMYLDEKFKPSTKVVQLDHEQGIIFFDDFNFDGTEDFAIGNGNDGPYGSPVYDIYVFNRSQNKFVLSQELSALTQENIGMFDVDQQKKRLKVMTKDGCCYHIWSEYKVIPNKGLLLVREFIESVVTAGDKVEVTERNLVNGKWKEKTKYYPIDQYYK